MEADDQLRVLPEQLIDALYGVRLIDQLTFERFHDVDKIKKIKKKKNLVQVGQDIFDFRTLELLQS